MADLVGMVRDVVSSELEIRREDRALQRQLALWHEKNTTQDDRIRHLGDLLRSPILSETSRDRLVETICQLALR